MAFTDPAMLPISVARGVGAFTGDEAVASVLRLRPGVGWPAPGGDPRVRQAPWPRSLTSRATASGPSSGTCPTRRPTPRGTSSQGSSPPPPAIPGFLCQFVTLSLRCVISPGHSRAGRPCRPTPGPRQGNRSQGQVMHARSDQHAGAGRCPPQSRDNCPRHSNHAHRTRLTSVLKARPAPPGSPLSPETGKEHTGRPAAVTGPSTLPATSLAT